jgi:lipoprotein-releasing system permease protein
MSFTLKDGYDTRDHLADGPTREREDMRRAGWENRRRMDREQKEQERILKSATPAPPATGPTVPPPEPFADRQIPTDPFARQPLPEQVKIFDPSKEQNPGVVLGIAMSNYRKADGEEHFRILPGEDVRLSFPTAGAPPKVVSDTFTIVDFYESKMLEYDSMFVFMPIKELQRLRGMFDRSTGVGYVNAIEIKLRPGADGNAVRDKLRAAFAPGVYRVETWRDKQGALLAAVQMETTILNILLFLIIAVAGFGILAIFYMIVVEKTRDIGILKSLGASGRGVMGIFLTYGLSLGLVGSGVGLVLGLTFVHYINPIADGLGWVMGRPLFNPEIYYLYRIPTIVFPETAAWIVIGALCIAVLASVLPALRAARLHPVEALRYE